MPSPSLHIPAEAPVWAQQIVRDIEQREILAAQVRALFPLNPFRALLAELPAPEEFLGCYLSVTDATGGPAWCYSDGLDWRRDRDNSVVS